MEDACRGAKLVIFLVTRMTSLAPRQASSMRGPLDWPSWIECSSRNALASPASSILHRCTAKFVFQRPRVADEHLLAVVFFLQCARIATSFFTP